MRVQIRRSWLKLLFLVVLAATVSAWASTKESAPKMQFLSTQDVLGNVWNQFLAAMRSGSDRAVRSQCTVSGFQSLLSQMNNRESHEAQWRRWGQEWPKAGPIRWRSITSIIAYGRLGAQNKEVSINFVLTPAGWKLDQWSPGE